MSRLRRDTLPVGKDAFRVLCPDGKVLDELGHLPIAVVRAQALALQEPEPIALTIQRKGLFGPAVTLRRITREVSGVILTHTVADED